MLPCMGRYFLVTVKVLNSHTFETFLAIFGINGIITYIDKYDARELRAIL